MTGIIPPSREPGQKGYAIGAVAQHMVGRRATFSIAQSHVGLRHGITTTRLRMKTTDGEGAQLALGSFDTSTGQDVSPTM